MSAMSREMQILAMVDGLERVRRWAVEVVDERLQPGMRRMKKRG